MQQILIRVLCLSFLFSSFFGISAAPASAVERSFDWLGASDYIRHCSTQPYWTLPSGQKVYGPLKSICPELQVSERIAKFPFQGVNYIAILVDSRDADGGDLNDLQLFDSQGHLVGRVDEVLAFGDVLLTLSSNHQNVQ